ncbi:hypothetical protein F4782DRAFT_552036 [Xylaria castorea]|nr:hypothetical protein F4782DRAFT_552036 [Xylaria castorea]
MFPLPQLPPRSNEEPRILVDEHGRMFTKAEWLETWNTKGIYDDRSYDDLIDTLEGIVMEGPYDMIPTVTSVIQDHLATGELSNDQIDTLNSIKKKMKGMDEVIAMVLLALQTFPADEPTAQIAVQFNTTLHDEVRARAILVLEMCDTQMGHRDWMEHFARTNCRNLQGLLKDAREFPEPPWQPEQPEQPVQPVQPEQPEQPGEPTQPEQAGQPE